jgi:O-antigen ligase
VRDVVKAAASMATVAITAGLAIAYVGPRVTIGFTILVCAALLGGLVLFRRRLFLATSLRMCPSSSALNRERPHVFTEILFVLLLSGPPMFRPRDPLASLRGEVDAVVIFQLLVWGMAGIWILLQLFSRRVTAGQLARLWLPQKLGLGLVLCLGCSALVSPAPLFTVFKVYQMTILLLFGFLFVKRYGVETCLGRLLLGYTIICVGAIMLAFIAPEVTLNPSTDLAFPRWRGDLYVPIGTVTVFAIALLLANPPAVSKPVFLVTLGLFSTLLALSQTRTAYVAMFVFVVLAILRRPKVTTLRRFLWAIPISVVILFLTGLMPYVTQGIIREPESVPDLSGRMELWRYVSDVALKKSPLIGLGYYSASRILSLEFAPNMGNAHSGFVEVLVGGGILSLAVLALLWCVLIGYILTLLSRKNDSLSFAASSLLPLVFLMAAGGWGDFDAGPVALTFWCLAAMLPLLRAQV